MFPYYYKDGELFGLHFGSFSKNEDELIALMRAEAEFLTGQSHGVSGIWIDFYGTKLTERVLGEFLKYLVCVRGRILKLAVVGCSVVNRWRIRRLVRRTEGLGDLPLRFYADPEQAKKWLVRDADRFLGSY